MEFVIQKKPLLRLAKRANSVADSKSPMPALACVHISADDGKVVLSATDLQVASKGTSEATVKRPGAVAVSAKDFRDRIDAMPDGPISVVSNDGASIAIKAHGSSRRYTLRGMRGEDFPTIPSCKDDAPRTAVPIAILGDAIRVVQHAISTDTTRPHLSSALFEIRPDSFRAVATNAHVLACSDYSRHSGDDVDVDILVPLKGAQELRAMCEAATADQASTVILAKDDSRLFAWSSDFELGVLLADAAFPTYEQVIPKRPEVEVRVDRAALLDSVKAIGVASDKMRCIKMSLSDGVLSVSASSSDKGDGVDELDIEYSGKGFAIGFDQDLLSSALGAIGEESVSLEFGGELDPLVIRPWTTQDDRKFLEVVMPMRI